MNPRKNANRNIPISRISSSKINPKWSYIIFMSSWRKLWFKTKGTSTAIHKNLKFGVLETRNLKMLVNPGYKCCHSSGGDLTYPIYMSMMNAQRISVSSKVLSLLFGQWNCLFWFRARRSLPMLKLGFKRLRVFMTVHAIMTDAALRAEPAISPSEVILSQKRAYMRLPTAVVTTVLIVRFRIIASTLNTK